MKRQQYKTINNIVKVRHLLATTGAAAITKNDVANGLEQNLLVLKSTFLFESQLQKKVRLVRLVGLVKLGAEPSGIHTSYSSELFFSLHFYVLGLVLFPFVHSCPGRIREQK